MTAALAAPRRLLRTSLWWSAKVLPLVGAALLGALLADAPAADALPLLLAMVVSAAGIAGASHLVNDWADVEADALAGKANAVAALSVPVRGLLVGLGALVGVVPWAVVAPGPVVWAAVVGLLVVPLAYSCPPLRLKGRGLAGVVADALDAHVLPTVVALALAAEAGTTAGPGWWPGVVGALAWSAGFGVRSILEHQRRDRANDVAGGAGTFVVRRGDLAAVRLGTAAMAVELAGVAAICFALLLTAPWVVAGFGAYLLLWALHRRWDRRPIEPVPGPGADWMVLAEFYEVWPTLGFGIALVGREAAWWPAPAAVVVLFWPTVAKQAADLLLLVASAGHDLGAAAAAGWWRFHRGPLAAFRFGVVPGVRWAIHDAWADLGHFQRRQRRRLRRYRGDASASDADAGSDAQISS